MTSMVSQFSESNIASINFVIKKFIKSDFSYNLATNVFLFMHSSDLQRILNHHF